MFYFEISKCSSNMGLGFYNQDYYHESKFTFFMSTREFKVQWMVYVVAAFTNFRISDKVVHLVLVFL